MIDFHILYSKRWKQITGHFKRVFEQKRNEKIVSHTNMEKIDKTLRITHSKGDVYYERTDK